MQRFLVYCSLIAALLVSVGTVPVALAYTGPGTAVDSDGMDNATATIQAQAKGGAGKAFGLILGAIGLGTFATGFHLAGGLAAGTGGAVAFAPGIYNGFFDSAAAATIEVATGPVPFETWWAPAMALLYVPMMVVHRLQDPVFVACLAIAVCGVCFLPTATKARA